MTIAPDPANSSIPADSSSATDPQLLAALQRQRTFAFYNAICRAGAKSNSSSSSTADSDLRIKLLDDKPPLTASRISAVDASESKFAVKGLHTTWGFHRETVCIRGEDISHISVSIPKKKNGGVEQQQAQHRKDE